MYRSTTLTINDSPMNTLVFEPDGDGPHPALIIAQHLPVAHFHSLKAGSYGAAHRDPFDRLLAAQSELESLVLVTRDPAYQQFGTPTLW